MLRSSSLCARTLVKELYFADLSVPLQSDGLSFRLLKLHSKDVIVRSTSGTYCYSLRILESSVGFLKSPILSISSLRSLIRSLNGADTAAHLSTEVFSERLAKETLKPFMEDN